MPKKISITLLCTMVVVIVALFAYTEVMASDCSVESDPTGTCWDFVNLKHKIEFLGVFDVGGLKEFRYKVTKTGNVNLNHWNFGIPVCKSNPIVIQESFPNSNQYPACAGDPATDVGVGDCEHTWVRLQRTLAKNAPEIWYMRVNPPVKINTIPIHLKSGNDYEFGAILGPACSEDLPINQTKREFTIVDGAGNKYETLIITDQAGNVLEIYVNGVLTEGRDISEVVVCVPTSPDPVFPTNYNCEPMNYAPDYTTLKAGESTSCPIFIGGIWIDPCAGL